MPTAQILRWKAVLLLFKYRNNLFFAETGLLHNILLR